VMAESANKSIDVMMVVHSNMVSVEKGLLRSEEEEEKKN